MKISIDTIENRTLYLQVAARCLKQLRTASVTCVALRNYLMKSTIWGGGGVIEHNMCDLVFSTNFVRNIFYFVKNSVKYRH